MKFENSVSKKQGQEKKLEMENTKKISLLDDGGKHDR